MVDVQTEQILVVPTEKFHELGHFQGFSTDVSRYLDHLLRPELTSYRPRGEMEEDPSFKQLIPYVVFRYTAADGGVSLFQYQRGAGQGESRLHAKRSVGIGGHISAIDADASIGQNPYEEGMRRELDEEVAIDTTYQPTCVGMINDDETEVGRVHLGVVHVFDVAEPRVQAKEDEIVASGFRPIAEIVEKFDEFESWSQIFLDAFYRQ